MDFRRLETWIDLGLLALVGWFFVQEPGLWLRACFGWLWGAKPEPSSVSGDEGAALGADEQTDAQTDVGVSAVSVEPPRLQVDRTRAAIIDTLVGYGWSVAEVRGVVKGDNNAISAEVAAARQRLGLEDAPRTIPVRDSAGERLMTM